jgi:hypothetical protein
VTWNGRRLEVGELAASLKWHPRAWGKVAKRSVVGKSVLRGGLVRVDVILDQEPVQRAPVDATVFGGA